MMHLILIALRSYLGSLMKSSPTYLVTSCTIFFATYPENHRRVPVHSALTFSFLNYLHALILVIYSFDEMPSMDASY